MQILLDKISKKYKSHQALQDISLTFEEGELVTLIGPSGSGKTTLLKIIAGLESPTSGNIYVDNKAVTNLSPQDRGIGFVFQHYALFKHMTVFENISFAYKVKPKKLRLEKQIINNKVIELAKLVQIEDLLERYPHELSGGQRQRVALARALAVEPKVLLLDEPFAALDAKLKQELRKWLRNLKRNSNITIVLVTHDQEEALDIADRVFVLNKGSIEQIGSSEEIYHNPANSFVYNFLGHYNVFRAIKTKDDKISIIGKEDAANLNKDKWYKKHKIVSNLFGILSTNKDKELYQMSESFDVFVRPYDIEITLKPQNSEFIEAKVIHTNLAAAFVKIELESPDYELIHAEISHESFNKLQIKKDQMVYIKPRQVTLFID